MAASVAAGGIEMRHSRHSHTHTLRPTPHTYIGRYRDAALAAPAEAAFQHASLITMHVGQRTTHVSRWRCRARTVTFPHMQRLRFINATFTFQYVMVTFQHAAFIATRIQGFRNARLVSSVGGAAIEAPPTVYVRTRRCNSRIRVMRCAPTLLTTYSRGLGDDERSRRC